MTVEQSVFVRIPREAERNLVDLVSRAESALARAGKLPPGDRTETIRFDALHAAIDQTAIAAMASGEPFIAFPSAAASEDCVGVSVFGPDRHCGRPEGEAARWVQEGYWVVELRLPHFSGETTLRGAAGVGPPRPAERWASTGTRGKDAVQARFDFLLSQALLEKDRQRDACLRPSGISNSLLTEGLRKHIQCPVGQDRVNVPVEYRDGSKGAPFPLRALRMTDQKPTGWRCFRFTLLSIRHVEMDHMVDGAWLRNVSISRNRAAGLTDSVVFNISLRQFRRLASDGPTLLHLYQTGLETAIVGFYRALTYQLLEAPGSIAVVPWYYHDDGSYTEGTIWATD